MIKYFIVEIFWGE